ncbi:MAG TPA: shikimate dehydrogenase, partial [Bacteroidia bacterium]|nr:shikimate dehydrogenase [Bacteroidia bacterium]
MPKMKLYGLIGFPLTHSYSKILFDKMFAQHQIGDSSYKLFPLEDLSALDHLIVETPDLIGLNVTIPYKVKIISLLNQLSPEAQSIGAINCVFIQRNANRYFLSGHNTDASAFFSTLTEFNLQAVKRALIIGNGGAAKAVIYSLNKSGIEFKIAGRKGSKGVDYQLTLMDQIEFSNFDLIVNCTPVGM